jgi:hypothetical protein
MTGLVDRRTAYTKNWDLSSAGLHVIAMASMLIDHGMKTVIENDSWIFVLGRLAFPIFAFMVAEGCFYTKNYRQYMLRMLVFALISEVPYDMMKSSTIVEWYDQNVMWTFLLALICVRMIQAARKTGKKKIYIPGTIAAILFGFVSGMILMVDYGGMGVLTVVLFYLLRERKWWTMLLQFILLFFINVVLLGALGFAVSVSFMGQTVEIPMQGFAVLALIPIWLYRGRQGYHSKGFQYFCYGFYPVHMLVLALMTK